MPSLQQKTFADTPLSPALLVGHLSDTHLGRKGPGDPQGAGRLQALRRALDALAGAGASVIVIAGDVFDSPQANRALVEEAAKLCQRPSGADSEPIPVVVIPGNHDPADSTSIWLPFREALEANGSVHLALVPTVYRLCDDRLLIEAYPCETRFSPDPPWVQRLTLPPDVGNCFRVVVAHGTLKGGPVPEGESDAYPFDDADIRALGADYVALGHFHGVYPPWPPGDACTFGHCYSGTPEPDQFGGDSGFALLVGLSRSEPPRASRIRCGRRNWQQVAVNSPTDLARVDSLLRTVAESEEPSRFVIRLQIGAARLSPDEVDRLQRAQDALLALGAHVDRRGDVRPHFTPETFDLDSLPSGAVREALLSLKDELLATTDAARREALTAALQLGWERMRPEGGR